MVAFADVHEGERFLARGGVTDISELVQDTLLAAHAAGPIEGGTQILLFDSEETINLYWSDPAQFPAEKFVVDWPTGS